MIIPALAAVAALLMLAPLAIWLAASQRGSTIAYGASLVVTAVLFVIALVSLLDPSPRRRSTSSSRNRCLPSRPSRR